MGNHVGSSVGGLALGAAAMYLLDPAQGRKRRARLRDQLVRLEHRSEATAQLARRDLQNRARGLYAELRARLRPGPIDDEILAERVRSKIGRLVSHPHALHIEAHAGAIVLRGDILTREIAPLMLRVRAVRGVRHLDNQLTPHEQSFGVPALQGGRPAVRRASEWSPSVRALAGLSGLALSTRALRDRGAAGLMLGALGASLLLRGLTNQPPQRWLRA